MLLSLFYSQVLFILSLILLKITSLTKYFHVFIGLVYYLAYIVVKNSSKASSQVINHVFYSLLLASIAYSIIVIGLIYREVPGVISFEKNNPVLELNNRLIYYPIIQIVTFVPVTWYVFLHPSVRDDDDYNNMSENLNIYKASFCRYSIFNYSTGIGFFIVFLKVTPNAYKFLIKSTKVFFGYTIDSNSETNSIRDSNDCSDISSLSDMELTQLIIENRRHTSTTEITTTTRSQFHSSDKSVISYVY